MHDLTFADLVLPRAGLYCLAPRIVKPNGDSFMKHIFTENTATLDRIARDADAERFTTVYFSTGSFAAESENHRQANLIAKQCLHIDIDVGHPSFVQSQQDAVVELYNLCSIANIPPPSVIVSSGYGVHAYWSFDVPFVAADMDLWQQLANGLLIAAEKHTPSLTKDRSKWVDRTALLRWPGTYNRKSSDARQVVEIGGTYQQYPVWMFDALKVYEPTVPARKQASKKAIGAVDGEVLRDHCAVLKLIVDEQMSIGYHAWRDIVWMSYHTTQGLDWAHEISQAIPGYNANDVDHQFDWYANAYESGQYRPALCTTFCKNAGFDHDQTCINCPLYGRNKSPVHLTSAAPIVQQTITSLDDFKKFADADVVIPHYLNSGPVQGLGSSFTILHDGTVHFIPEHITDEAKATVLFSHPWWLVSRTDDNGQTNYDVLRVLEVSEQIDEHGNKFYGPKRVNMMKLQGVAFADHKQLAKGLSSIGVHVMNIDRYHLQAAFEYAKVSRTYATTSQEQARSFGWQHDGRFVIGRGAILRDGAPIAYSMAGPLLARDNDEKVASMAIADSATLMGVMGAMKMFSEHSDKFGKAMLLSALCAPLFKMIDLPGYIILLTGTSGKGKTSLQRLLSCLYGRPNAAMISWQDTLVTWPRTVALYNSLPVTFDDFTHAGKSNSSATNEDSKDHFIFSITQGRVKTVGTADQVNVGGGDRWNTIVVASSNWDYVSGLRARDKTDRLDAVLSRMSQIAMPATIMPFKEWSMVAKAFEENHGLFGVYFVDYVQRNYEAVKQRLEDDLRASMASVKSEARFKMMFLACLVVAQQILKSLGIADFGLTKNDLAEIMTLDRLSQSDEKNVWAKASISEVGSERGNEMIELMLLALNDNTVQYIEKPDGTIIPSAHQSSIRQPMARVVVARSSVNVYHVAKFAVTMHRELRTIAAPLLAACETYPTERASLTEDGIEVECWRIEKRNAMRLVGGTNGP